MARKEETRNRIMHVALRLFSEQGYYATPTKKIAQEAGVNELTLFRHFGSKEKLFHETTKKYVEDINLKNEITHHITMDFETSMIEIAKDYLDYCYKNERIYKIQMRLNDDEKEFVRLKLSRNLKEILSEYFDELIEKGSIEGDSETMAATFINSILGAFTVYLLTHNTFTNVDLESLVIEHAKQFANYYKKEK
jgi:AcrR family transcriptional regulator